MRTSGYNVWWHKFIVFVIAGAFAGVSGVLYTYSTQFISPTVLGVETSFEAMLMVIIGGAGTLTGPLIGGCRRHRATQLPERVLRGWVIILGLGYIITVFFAPQGILGLLPAKMAGSLRWGRSPPRRGTRRFQFRIGDSSRADPAVGGTLHARDESG